MIWLGATTADGNKSYLDGEISVAGTDELRLGKSYIVAIRLLHPEYAGPLKPGDHIELSEGPNIVGTGEVLESTLKNHG